MAPSAGSRASTASVTLSGRRPRLVQASPLGTRTTGQAAAPATASAVDPSDRPAQPPSPRAPRTIISASRLWNSSAGAAAPASRSLSTRNAGWRAASSAATRGATASGRYGHSSGASRPSKGVTWTTRSGSPCDSASCAAQSAARRLRADRSTPATTTRSMTDRLPSTWPVGHPVCTVAPSTRERPSPVLTVARCTAPGHGPNGPR